MVCLSVARCGLCSALSFLLYFKSYEPTQIFLVFIGVKMRVFFHNCKFLHMCCFVVVSCWVLAECQLAHIYQVVYGLFLCFFAFLNVDFFLFYIFLFVMIFSLLFVALCAHSSRGCAPWRNEL